MRSTRLRMITALLAAGIALAACASTTDGTGSAAGAASSGSSPDFPSRSASAPSTAPSADPLASGASASSSPGSGRPVHPAPSAPLRTVTVPAQAATYVVKIWADVNDDSCFDHAYGRAMITFLTQHPCRGLQRYLGTTTVHGRPVAFAESTTSFHGPSSDPYVYSSKFTRLEEADGTGSISDLLREGYRLPSGPTSIPAAETFAVIGQDNGVTVWDAWYLDGPTRAGDKALIAMTRDLFLQF